MIQVIRNVQQMRLLIRKQMAGTIGFVPTMGALHRGHETLLKKSRSENSISVLSIFVNPTQFNNPEDLTKYPITFEKDLELAERAGVDVVFAPEFSEIYPDNYRYLISEKINSKDLCGASRPGHFEGVLTVVMKLLQIVQPTRAYFGEKDFQQLELIRGMAGAFFLDTEIVAVPTVREHDGLAMSSRNLRLNDSARIKAAKIFELMCALKTAEDVRRSLEAEGFTVDYVVDKDRRRYVAAFLNDVRLIDNVEI